MGGRGANTVSFSSFQHSCSYKYQHEIGLGKDPEHFESRDRHFFNKTLLKQGQTLARLEETQVGWCLR